jgi:hypothetical protein
MTSYSGTDTYENPQMPTFHTSLPLTTSGRPKATVIAGNVLSAKKIHRQVAKEHYLVLIVVHGVIIFQVAAWNPTVKGIWIDVPGTQYLSNTFFTLLHNIITILKIVRLVILAWLSSSW